MDIKDSYLHSAIGVVKSIEVGDGKLTYKLADVGNTPRTFDLTKADVIPFIIGTHTQETVHWTGTTSSINELYDGLTIRYWVPYNSTGNAVDLNLTLANGTNTGQIECYYTGYDRLTTHIKAGSPVTLTYRVNPTISGVEYNKSGWWMDADNLGYNYETFTNGANISYKKVVISKDRNDGFGILVHSRAQHYLISSGLTSGTTIMNTFYELGTNLNNNEPSASLRCIHIKMVATAASQTVTLYIAVDGYTYFQIVCSDNISIQDSTESEYNGITSSTTGWVACKYANWNNTTYSVFKKHTSDNSGGYNGLVPVPSYTTTTTRFLREDGTWVVPTDNKVLQEVSSNSKFRCLLLGTTQYESTPSSPSEITGLAYITKNIYVDPSKATLYADTFVGKLAYTNLTGSTTTANQAIVSNGTANGWTLKTLGSNAFNSTAYLPLSGGTLTGALTIKCTADAKLILDNIDTETNFLYIDFRQNNTSYGTLGITTVGGTNLQWAGKTLLHTGNYSTTLDGRYYTESEIDTKLGNYVTLNTNLTITGTKTFSNSIKTDIIDNISDSNKITLVPHFSYSGLGVEASSTAEVYLKAWLKKVCELYPGSKGIFRGTISPGSTKMIEVHIYSTSRKDAETGLPEHSFGVCYNYSRTHHYTFGTLTYVFGCNIMLTDSNYTSYTYSKSGVDSKIAAIANLKNTTITTYAGLTFTGIKGYVNTNTAIASNDFVATNSSAAIGWGKDNSKVLLASQASKNDGTIFIRQYYTSWGAWNKLLHSGNYTDYIYSKSQTDDAISEAIANLVGSAPETLNTLEEISKYLEDGTVAGGLLEQLSNKVDKTDTTYLKTYTRKDIGTSPNFDDPGINGVFEVRNSTETTGETGTKPFNAYGPMLSVKAENVLLQIASQSLGSLRFRSKQSDNVTLKDIPWRTLLDSVNYTDYVYSKSLSTANFYGATTSRTANTVLAAPNGKDGVATFRKLVETDIPNLNWTKITNTPTTLNGYGITDALQTKQLFTKKDYEHWVVLLCKIGTNTSLTCHRLSGKIHTHTKGSTRYQAADVDLYKSDWSAGNDGYLRFTPYGLGTNWKLVTCTYDGSTWLGLSNTNTQQTTATFDGTSYNIDFTAIHYYTSNTQTVVNSEINSSIKEVTDYTTVLSSDNYNSYSPKLDGTGATGTWDINISGVASKLNVNQHTANDVEYPIVWSNQTSTQSNAANQLYKSYGKLSYNPKNNRITATTFKGNLKGSASYLISVGTVNPQTGRTLDYGHVYSYNTAGIAHEGAPTTYTSVIGFGRGTGGTVEIAGGWTSSMGLWYRALRDTADDWYDWVRILDSKNYTSYLGYVGTTAVQASPAAQGLTGITNITATGSYTSSSMTDTTDRAVRVQNKNGYVGIRVSTKRGLYDYTRDNWMIYRDKNSDTYLSTKTYFLNGVNIANDATIGKSVFITTELPTLKIYSGMITDAVSDGNICLLTGIDSVDGLTHEYPTKHQTRHNLILQPRGGQVYVGHDPGDSPVNTYKLNVGGLAISTGYCKKDSSNDYILLGGGGHKKIDDLVVESNITTIQKTLTVTQDWMDTGIKYQDLSVGTYIVQVFVNANNSTGLMYLCYFSGVMSWYNGGTNDSESDEIILHRSGHAYRNTIYLRTTMTTNSDGRHLRLQIAANKNLGAAYTYTFKFKKMI